MKKSAKDALENLDYNHLTDNASIKLMAKVIFYLDKQMKSKDKDFIHMRDFRVLMAECQRNVQKLEEIHKQLMQDPEHIPLEPRVYLEQLADLLKNLVLLPKLALDRDEQSILKINLALDEINFQIAQLRIKRPMPPKRNMVEQALEDEADRRINEYAVVRYKIKDVLKLFIELNDSKKVLDLSEKLIESTRAKHGLKVSLLEPMIHVIHDYYWAKSTLVAGLNYMCDLANKAQSAKLWSNFTQHSQEFRKSNDLSCEYIITNGVSSAVLKSFNQISSTRNSVVEVASNQEAINDLMKAFEAQFLSKNNEVETTSVDIESKTKSKPGRRGYSDSFTSY